MSKRIIQWKLIKRYPNIRYNIGKIIEFNEAINGYLENWPEFWEPVYEETIDLHFILMNTSTSRCAIKEACKQTLELVINHLKLSDQAEDAKEIKNLINRIE